MPQYKRQGEANNRYNTVSYDLYKYYTYIITKHNFLPCGSDWENHMAEQKPGLLLHQTRPVFKASPQWEYRVSTWSFVPLTLFIAYTCSHVGNGTSTGKGRVLLPNRGHHTWLTEQFDSGFRCTNTYERYSLYKEQSTAYNGLVRNWVFIQSKEKNTRYQDEVLLWPCPVNSTLKQQNTSKKQAKKKRPQWQWRGIPQLTKRCNPQASSQIRARII